MGVAVIGARKTLGKLREFGARAERLQPFLTAGAASLDALLEGVFAGGQGPSGSRWRRRKGDSRDDGHPLLQKSGGLRSSRLVVGEGTSIRASYGVYYARFFQFGTRNANGTVRMKPRALLPITARGGIVRGGPAGQWLNNLRRDLLKYVIHGEVP